MGLDLDRYRWELAINRFKTEIALLESRKSRYVARYTQIDMEMQEKIENISTGEIRTKLKEMWKKDTFLEENTSVQRWQNKEKWFNNMLIIIAVRKTNK